MDSITIVPHHTYLYIDLNIQLGALPVMSMSLLCCNLISIDLLSSLNIPLIFGVIMPVRLIVTIKM
jgi:hypothetical protein